MAYRRDVGGSNPSSPNAGILDAFLAWARANKAPRTYGFRHRNIRRFLNAIPPALAIDDLKPNHATRAMDAPG